MLTAKGLHKDTRTVTEPPLSRRGRVAVSSHAGASLLIRKAEVVAPPPPTKIWGWAHRGLELYTTPTPLVLNVKFNSTPPHEDSWLVVQGVELRLRMRISWVPGLGSPLYFVTKSPNFRSAGGFY